MHDHIGKLRAAVAAGAAVAAMVPALAWGRPLLEADFAAQPPGAHRDRVVEEVGGRTGVVNAPGRSFAQGGARYALPGLSPTQGTIQLPVARRAPGFAQDYLLQVGDAFRVYVRWVDGDGSFVTIDPLPREDGAPSPNENVWGRVLPLGRPVAVGEWVLLTLRWGPGSGENRVYANTAALRATVPESFAARGPDLAGAGTIWLGQEERREGAEGPVNRHTQQTLLGGLAVYDHALSEAEIAAAVAHWVSNVPDYPADVAGLTGSFVNGAVELGWNAAERAAGYAVYRRSGAGNARFEKLTAAPVTATAYRDEAVRAGATYRYTVYGVSAGGIESKDSVEVEVTAAAVSVASVAAEKASYGSGQEIVVTLRGTKDGAARFTLAGIASDAAMEEVDDGVYVGKVRAPAGVAIASAALTGTLAVGEETATGAGGAVAVDGVAPSAPSRILATVPFAGELEVGWTASASADVAKYAVYRGVGKAPDLAAAPLAEVKGLGFVDTAVTAGLSYQYAVVAVDQAGNKSAPSEIVSAKAVAGEGPAITGITVEPFGKPVKPGQAVTLTVTGPSGGSVAVNVGALAEGLALAEAGRTGIYRGTYTVKDADVGATKGLHRVVARLADAYGASELAGPELAVVGRDVLNDRTAPVIAGASHDGFQVAGFSGALVAGDVVTVTLEGEPAGYAAFEIPGVVARTPMAEGKAGTYTGTYTVGWGDEGASLPVVAYLADEAGNETSLTVGRPLALDTRVRLLVTAKDTLLPADKKSTTRLVAKASDANGDDVSGHELALTLSTTEEYTGVVGGGRIEDKEARMEDEDDLEVKWGGVTDSFGEVAATYTAGFAAKTALVVAKDLTTGDVGAGWLNTYVSATVAIELTPRAAQRGAVDQAILKLTADPTKLTADGRSTSRLTATLTDLSGNPMAGQKVAFALGNDNGRVRVLDGSTDGQGIAQAEYRAGTLMGTVTVTASVAELGVTASVQIVLMADAPAKIEFVASAAKLPADGKSTAGLSVAVTDIHDNPNAQVPVTFAVLQGSGTVEKPAILTDRNGEGAATFTAGTKAGLAIVEARHTSRAPTEDELRRVYGTVFVPRLAERQERDRVQVAKWLVKPGDEVAKGAPLVTLEGGKATWTLTAPATGTFVREVKHRRDRVELGDTLGYVEIDEKVWQDEYRQ